jgi:hypothetical protein
MELLCPRTKLIGDQVPLRSARFQWRAHAFRQTRNLRGLRSAQPTRHFVTTGLDPVVHAEQPNAPDRRMDCRVKPGSDALVRRHKSKMRAFSAALIRTNFFLSKTSAFPAP